MTPAHFGGSLQITRGDVTISVTDLSGDGPPLLLLHGLAGSSREMLATADALIDSFRVLLVDQRGHGRSTRRPEDLWGRRSSPTSSRSWNRSCRGRGAFWSANRWERTQPSSLQRPGRTLWTAW